MRMKMAKIETHCEDCIQVLGRAYREIHEWLDFYAKKYDPRLYLEKHRMYRHHDKGVKEAEKLFGHYGGLAAKLHIIRDNQMYVLFDINLIRENDIQPLYEKALIYCHKPIDEGNDDE